MKAVLFSLVLLIPAASSAAVGECVDIIRLSKVGSVTVKGSSAYEAEARAFCSDYASSKASGKAMSLGGSYGAISGNFGSSSQSAEQIASKVCDSADASKARSDAFQQYIDEIAPGAYSSYNRCIELQGDGLSITVNQPTILPKFYVVNVSYKNTGSGSQQTITFTASQGVACEWRGAGGKEVKLADNTGDALQCTRNDDTVKSAIFIIPKNKPNAQMSFPWTAYKGGVPVDPVRDLTVTVASATTSLNALHASLQGAVVGFNSAQCPSGWFEVKNAYGRFLRGIDKVGATDPAGPRAPGSVQEDAFKSHTHTRPKDVYDFGGPTVGSVAAGQALGYSFDGNSPAPPTGASGDAETRPKNMAVLFCQKQ